MELHLHSLTHLDPTLLAVPQHLHYIHKTHLEAPSPLECGDVSLGEHHPTFRKIVISDFFRGVLETFALLGYHAGWIGS